MVVILVEPAGALLQRSLELRGNTLEPYSCEVLASYAATKLRDMGCSVEVTCVGEPRPEATNNGEKVQIHVLQHGRDAVEDNDLARQIIALLKQGSKPYIVGFSVRTYAFRKAVALAAMLKASERDVKVVLGGYHPSVSCGTKACDLWKSVQIPAGVVDCQVIGEGEKPLTALLATMIGISSDIINNALWGKMQNGLAYPSLPTVKAGEWSEHKIGGDKWRLTQEEFEKAPSPVRSNILLKAWCRNWNLSYPSPTRQTGAFQIQYARGCSYNACSFCCTPYVFGFGTKNNVRYKRPDQVCEEIKGIRDSGCNFVYFNDVTFNGVDGKWKELCYAMIRHELHTPHMLTGHPTFERKHATEDGKIKKWINATAQILEENKKCTLNIPKEEDPDANIHWFALCRAETISLEDAVLLASAGCSKVGIGVESFCETVTGKDG
ncbi:MAG: hypothetical protein WCI73_06570, partial [Phycisphaerae bacterium]